ncbi:histidinol-phosphate transaminase [Campylobacter sp. FMV-PI01]|uniref:Histidinol-phosphate aminotransferase n=1 Tax=Campylobacter portucalensis TaxID=2608384 RepID=A0A6L5WIM3_9BACT|nr:histidinol-phosphate transaminase [Campylobacter portucalensis]MSN95663.1 histidinol-phosphate transaminase [Campylobacter portucalensis]
MKFNKHLKNINNYEAGKPIELVVREFGIKEDEVIKLASNENPNGVSKKALQALNKSINFANLYPDDSMFELKNSLSKKYNILDKNIIIGSGSDQIIEFIIHAKTNQNQGILVSKTTFAMYEIYAKHSDTKIFKTPSGIHNLNEFTKIYQENKDKISVIFLCVPNNPLGECLDAKDVYEFIKNTDEDTLIVIDGAYNEFAAFKDENKKINPKIISEFKNAIYLGTFSKLYGLGGMRVGYGIANENIISNLAKLRAPFNITTPSLAAAIAVLEDEDYIYHSLNNNLIEMKKFEEFAVKNGIKFIPSYTNFITFVLEKQDSTQICNSLLKKGIILRDLKSYNMNAIRITIGLKKQNEIVLKHLKELL